MINIISCKRTLLCYFLCRYICSSRDLISCDAVLAFVLVLHIYSVATLPHKNLPIRNKNYVSSAFYSPSLPTSAELTPSSCCTKRNRLLTHLSIKAIWRAALFETFLPISEIRSHESLIHVYSKSVTGHLFSPAGTYSCLPSAIQLVYISFKMALKGRFVQTSTGCSSDISPPGIIARSVYHF